MTLQELRAADIRKLPINDRLSVYGDIFGCRTIELLVDHARIPTPDTYSKAYINLEVTVPQPDGSVIPGVIKTPNRDGYDGRLLRTVILREVFMQLSPNEWPVGLFDAIGFPDVIEFDAPTESLLEQFVETRPVGTNHLAEKKALSVVNLHHLADAMRFVQQLGSRLIGNDEGLKKFFHFRISVPWVKAADENGKWQDKYHVDYYNNENRMVRLRKFLGDQVVDAMGLQLDADSTKHLFRDTAPRYFVFGNFIPGKMGIDEAGKIWILELERCCHTPNPASDLIALFTPLSLEPELQEELFRYAVTLNKDIPDYLEYARLDFIFNRGSGELNYFLEVIKNMEEAGVSKTDAHYVECQSARERLGKLISEAVNHTGIWEPSQYGFSRESV